MRPRSPGLNRQPQLRPELGRNRVADLHRVSRRPALRIDIGMGPCVAADAERDLTCLTDLIENTTIGGAALMRRKDVKASEEQC